MSTLFDTSHRKRAKRKQKALSTGPNDITAAGNELKREDKPRQQQQQQQQTSLTRAVNEEDFTESPWATFEDLSLAEPLVVTCRSLGFQKPTPVQRKLIPFLLREKSSHVLALAATGSGKTAAFCLPILHHLASDPYGIYAVIISPTRELAKQIHQQVLALGSSYNVQSALIMGGLDSVAQACSLDRKPHFVVATPGRLAELLRGPNPPNLRHVRYLVLDEADRLLAANSGFERDVAEILLQCRQDDRRSNKCQTLLFSATMTRSLESVEKIAGAGRGRLPLRKFVIEAETTSDLLDASSTKKLRIDTTEQDNEETSQNKPSIPAGLKQEYIFMPSRVRDAYLLSTIRTLMSNGGRSKTVDGKGAWTGSSKKGKDSDDDDDDQEDTQKARSAIVFVPTCEKAALVSGILQQVGVDNVALHSLLSQHRRLASLGKFKSQQVRILVATDVASRGLDIPSVDLVLNWELPRHSVSYVHRVGRTARAGRRGRAISFVGENDISLVHAAERISGRALEKCSEVTDEAAIRMLGPVTKAARLTKMKLMDIGFDELVKKFKERKVRDRKERERIEIALKKMEGEKS